MGTWKSASEIISEELEVLEREAVRFIGGVPVKHDGSRRHEGIVVIRPDYHWGSIDAQQRQTQLKLRRQFLSIHERLRLLFAGASPDIDEAVEEARKGVLDWLDLAINWSLSPREDENEKRLRGEFEPLRAHLRALTCEPGGVLIVPDTNALTAASDPTRYESIAGSKQFRFVLVAPVLTELDNLKFQARDELYRRKVAAVIRRISGWRRQGRLIDGVTVHQTITVLAKPQEPHFAETLSWLDPQNSDDRIVASIVELQRQFPSGCVVLVTGDLSLQNKADAAGIPWAEIPRS